MTPLARAHATPKTAMIWIALATVYVVWGSTYLGIRVVVQADIPPLFGMGTRFIAASAILVVLLSLRHGLRALRLTKREAIGSLVTGALLLLGGNGMVAVAEQTVPSGLAALLIATVPLWLVLFRAAGRDRPRGLTWLGVLVGFAGVGLLALRGGGIEGVEAWGVLLLIFATLSWATGSFFSSRIGLPRDPLVATTYEMLFGGVVMLLVSAASGETGRLHLASVPASGWIAWAYLVTVGSLLGYTAYVWLLANAPISLVATYAYVNPVVAVFLGWAILSEPVTGIVIAGGGIVVAGVALVVSAERPRAQPRPEPREVAELEPAI